MTNGNGDVEHVPDATTQGLLVHLTLRCIVPTLSNHITTLLYS